MPDRHLANEWRQSITNLVQNAVEMASFHTDELTVSDLRTQHATVTTDRLLGTRYGQTETTQPHSTDHRATLESFAATKIEKSNTCRGLSGTFFRHNSATTYHVLLDCSGITAGYKKCLHFNIV